MTGRLLRVGGLLGFGLALLCGASQAVGMAYPLWDVLLFSQNTDGQSDLFLADTTGRVVNLTRTPNASEADPVWSPDGTRIAYISNATFNDEVHIMDFATGATQQITDTPEAHASPSWSPDGTALAFAYMSNPMLNQFDVFTMDLATGERRNLTPVGNGGVVVGMEPQWSPDGEHVLFINQNRLTVHVVAVGDGTMALETPPGRMTPAWSPDGVYIVYVGPRDRFTASVNDTLFVQSATSPDAPPERYITDMRYVQSPVWSPSGDAVAFVAEPINTPSLGSPQRFATFRMDVFLVDVVTGDIRRLTDIGNMVISNSLAWSPDGTQLALRYDDNRTDTAYLCVQRVRSDRHRCIPNLPADDVQWQPPRSSS